METKTALSLLTYPKPYKKADNEANFKRYENMTPQKHFVVKLDEMKSEKKMSNVMTNNTTQTEKDIENCDDKIFDEDSENSGKEKDLSELLDTSDAGIKLLMKSMQRMFTVKEKLTGDGKLDMSYLTIAIAAIIKQDETMDDDKSIKHIETSYSMNTNEPDNLEQITADMVLFSNYTERTRNQTYEDGAMNKDIPKDISGQEYQMQYKKRNLRNKSLPPNHQSKVRMRNTENTQRKLKSDTDSTQYNPDTYNAQEKYNLAIYNPDTYSTQGKIDPEAACVKSITDQTKKKLAYEQYREMLKQFSNTD